MSDAKSAEKVQGEAEGGAAAAGGLSYPDPRSLESVVLQARDFSRRRLYEFLAALEREDFVRPLDCLAGGSIRDKLVHSIGVERHWTSVLQNRQNTRLVETDFPTVESCLAVALEATDRTLNILRTADAGWFTREDLFGLPGGGPMRLVPSMVILHILTHEFHHKGQICCAARSLGYTPPDLDFI